MRCFKKLPQDCHPRSNETASAVEAKLAGQVLEVPAQDGDGVAEAREAGIAADFADGTKDADGAELLKDVSIAENGGLDSFRLVARLMLPDDGENGRNLRLGEARLTEDSRGMGAGIGDVVPTGQFLRVFGAMSGKNTEIVQPGGSDDNLAVMGKIGAKEPGQLHQAGLVAEFIHRPSLGFDVLGQPVKGSGGHDTFVIFHKSFDRDRIRWESGTSRRFFVFP